MKRQLSAMESTHTSEGEIPQAEFHQDVFALESREGNASSASRPHTFQDLTTYHPQAQCYPTVRHVSQYVADKIDSQPPSEHGESERPIQANQLSNPSEKVAPSSSCSSAEQATCTAAVVAGGPNAAGDGSAVIDYIGSAIQRPGYTYEELALMALEVLPSNKGSVSEIYDVIEQHFPFFKIRPSKTWKSSLRHSITRSPYTRKVQTSQEDHLTHIDSSANPQMSLSADGHTHASNVLPRKGGPRTPIIWELYEPAEDDVIGRKKPRRDSLPPAPPAGFSISAVTPEVSRACTETLSVVEPGHMNPSGVSQQMPTLYSKLTNQKKVDANANFTGPHYPNQQMVYGTTVSPEMYPFVASLLDLSQLKKPSTVTRHAPYDFHHSTGTKKPKLASKPATKTALMPSSLPLQQHSHVYQRPEATTSDELHRSLSSPITVTASGLDYAKLPPSYFAASKTSAYINQSHLPKLAPQKDVTGGVASVSEERCCPVDFLSGGHPMIPSKTLPQTQYTWSAANVFQGSQPLMTSTSQHSQHQLPAQVPFAQFQRENTVRPISWKVQNGYLVQTARDPSPPLLPTQMSPVSGTLLPPAGSNFNFADADPSGHQLFQPWQVAQPLQYPYMQYQVPQSQRYPLYANPGAAGDLTSPARHSQNMRTSFHTSYPVAENMQQDRGFGSAASTPSLVDSGIVRDSRLDSLSPEGSEDTCSIPDRPGSQDIIIDDVV